MLKLDELFKLFEEVENTRILVEQDIETTGEQEKILKLPKFRISEQWGTPGTDDRKIIELFTSKIVGSSLKEKLSSLQAFVKGCDESCVQAKDISEILANLVFLDSLASLIYDFNDKTGGFLFESLLSVLLGGQSRQIPTPGGPKQPIEDLLDSDGKSPLSLKFLFSGPKYIKGSEGNLAEGVLKYKKPIKFIVALKEREGEDVLSIKFLTFNYGLKPGEQIPDQIRKKYNIQEEVVPQGWAGEYNTLVEYAGQSIGQFSLYTEDLRAEHIGTLDIGSRKQIQSIAQRYVSRLGTRLTSIYEELDLLSKNINTYFLSSPDAKNSALAARQNAKGLQEKTEDLD